MQYDKKRLMKIAGVFKALGHPIRLWIVRRLDEGECCVCDIVDAVGVDFSTVSQHLNVLKRVGVVEDEKRGKHVFYRLVYPCIPWLVERMELRDSMTAEQIAQWNVLLEEERQKEKPKVLPTAGDIRKPQEKVPASSESLKNHESAHTTPEKPAASKQG